MVSPEDMAKSLRTLQIKNTLLPEKPGTVRLVDKYGDDLLCVRYRYDTVHKRKVKTVELIIEETDWECGNLFAPDQSVGVRVDLEETGLQKRLRQAGGIWNRSRKVWEVRYATVREFRLDARIMEEKETVSSAAQHPG